MKFTLTPASILALALALTALVYWPGLSGGYIFDDFPNIVDNTAIQADSLNLESMSAAALSSPSSIFKRPLASLSFAANHLLTGLDPYWMKLTNLLIHMINGLLAYGLAKILLSQLGPKSRNHRHIAALIAFAWLVLPINLTAVLYVVQRMESLAHLFVFMGLLGYCHGRIRMLDGRNGGTIICSFSVIAGTALGLLAKESAILLPLYAALVECFVFRFQHPDHGLDRRVIVFFLLVLIAPMVPGLLWLFSHVATPSAWAARDFTLIERLLSEPRIILSYIKWTLLPSIGDLSFYHDDVIVSRSLLQPWTTAPALVALSALVAATLLLRRKQPLIALGLALYLGAHTLTATILPLELIYEHRNYFASFGLLLCVVPTLVRPPSLATPAKLLLAILFALWIGLTAWTSWTWRHPITLAQEYAVRAPHSPRAQYALAQSYLIASNYAPESPYLKAAWPILEQAAALPKASALPESALIFSASKAGHPIAPDWWASLDRKLRDRPLSQENASAVMSLARCARSGQCNLPEERMIETFLAALVHSPPSARVLAAYGDYAWNVLQDRALAIKLAQDAVEQAPAEPEYLITLIKMQRVLGLDSEAEKTWKQLIALNLGGRLNARLQTLPPN
ncbi:MAG: hypothetical protein EVA65_08895 [Oceanococcus sp.]|nr:MAG: hypothetical protein EVA65_08895 [Oceanococcus sp.]